MFNAILLSNDVVRLQAFKTTLATWRYNLFERHNFDMF